MIKSVLKIILFFIIAVVGGIFADQILWPYFIERPLFYEYRLEKSPIFLTEKKEIYIEENTQLQNSFEKVEESLVGIKSISPKGLIIEGSGLIITNDGLTVTLNEIIPQGYNTSFYFNGEKISYQILKRDVELNLALVKLDGENFPTLGFKNGSGVKKGEKVFLVGSIFEKELVSKIINEGIIKNFNSNYVYTNILEKENLKGSILFDIKGEIVGINLVEKNKEVISIPSKIIKDFAGF